MVPSSGLAQELLSHHMGPTDAHWVEGNNAVIEILKDRIQPRDFICVIAGRCHEQIAQAFPNHMTVEFGIGYTGVFRPYKVFGLTVTCITATVMFMMTMGSSTTQLFPTTSRSITFQRTLEG